MFTPTGVAWNQVFLYGVDGTINLGLRSAGELATGSSDPVDPRFDVGQLGVTPINGTVVVDASGSTVGVVDTGNASVRIPVFGEPAFSSPMDLRPEVIKSQQCFLPSMQ